MLYGFLIFSSYYIIFLLSMYFLIIYFILCTPCFWYYCLLVSASSPLFQFFSMISCFFLLFVVIIIINAALIICCHFMPAAVLGPAVRCCNIDTKHCNNRPLSAICGTCCRWPHDWLADLLDDVSSMNRWNALSAHPKAMIINIVLCIYKTGETAAVEAWGAAGLLFCSVSFCNGWDEVVEGWIWFAYIIL